MTNENDTRAIAIASLLKGLSLLENDVYQMYKMFGAKVDLPFARSLILSIAIDSQKHSAILKGVGESIAKSKAKPKECEEKLHEVFNVTETFRREIVSKKMITVEELPELAQKLTVLESMLGEEYYIFTQLKTLEFMVSTINTLYNVDLGHLKNIFSEIIAEEEHHRELLETIKSIFNKNKQQTVFASAEANQSVASWIMSPPPTSWNRH